MGVFRIPIQTIASNESQAAKMPKAVGQDAGFSSAINPSDNVDSAARQLAYPRADHGARPRGV